jgi:hypothetical protein
MHALACFGAQSPQLTGGRTDRSCRMRRPTTWRPRRRESTVQSVDESVGFVEFLAQAGCFPARENLIPCVGATARLFSRFQLPRDLVDLHVEAMQQFPRLCSISVFAHCGILPSGSESRVLNAILPATECGARRAAPHTSCGKRLQQEGWCAWLGAPSGFRTPDPLIKSCCQWAF